MNLAIYYLKYMCYTFSPNLLFRICTHFQYYAVIHKEQYTLIDFESYETEAMVREFHALNPEEY